MNSNMSDKKLQNISWGLFLIMLGGLWIVPKDRLPSGIWLIGVGIIMLGLNISRYAFSIRVNRFTSILGLLAITMGLSSLYGVNLPLFPIIIILIGVSILIDSTRK